jgi:phosphoribosylamine--glycine ligase
VAHRTPIASRRIGGYTIEILEEHGVDTVDHHVFKNFDAGIRHVQANPAPS